MPELGAAIPDKCHCFLAGKSASAPCYTPGSSPVVLKDTDASDSVYSSTGRFQLPWIHPKPEAPELREKFLSHSTCSSLLRKFSSSLSKPSWTLFHWQPRSKTEQQGAILGGPCGLPHGFYGGFDGVAG